MPPVELWAWAFAETVVLEVPLVVAACWSVLGWRGVPVALGLQVATHPALWYLFPRFEPYAAWLVVAEGSVTTVEAALLAAALRGVGEPWRAAVGRAVVVAVVANTVSTLVGLALQ